jgi:DNA invertase Pin-like site-specific DNA recombinase
MRPAIGYIRVSTVKQGRSGLGLEAQQEALRRFAEAEGFAFVETFTESESGKRGDDHRPMLAAALERARKEKAPVIVAKLDRLSRDVHYVAGLMKHRVPFIVAEKARAHGLARVFAGLSGLSARKAAERLNAEGVPTPEGGKWHGAQVSRVRSRLVA